MAKDYDKTHYNNIEVYAKKISAIYDSAVKEAASSGMLVTGFNSDKSFSFANHPGVNKKLDKLLKSLSVNIEAVVLSGVEIEWALSDNKNKELLSSVFGDRLGKLTEEQKQRYFSNNTDALDAFKKRKTAGMGLSDRVWKYTDQFKTEIELGIDCGLRDRLSASEMARDLKQYLRQPDKLFRRVRDEHGQLGLSKAAKAFNPGQGNYRSSVRNAQRLARTEINMSYRNADHARWQKMDFVVGIEIKRSSNHSFACPLCNGLAGKYPKDFKFSGWHPQCRCFAIPIMMTDDEFWAENRTTNVNEVKDVPQGFTAWADKNKERFNSKNTPYFIRDNYVDGKVGQGLNLTQTSNKRIRTDAEKIAVQTRWDDRSKKNELTKRTSNNILKVAKDFPEIDASILMSLSKGNNLIALGDETRRVAKLLSAAKAEERKLSILLEDVRGTKSKFGIEATRELHDALESKLAQWKDLELVTQAKKLKFEINWVEEKKAYPMWKQAQAAYKKQLQKVNYNIERIEIIEGTKDAISLSKQTKSKAFKALAKDWDTLIKAGASNVELKTKASALSKLYIKEEKARLASLNKGARDISFYSEKHKTNESKNWTEQERVEVAGLRSKYYDVINKHNGDYRNPFVRDAQNELAYKLRELSMRHVGKQSKIGHIDGLVAKDVRASLKRYLGNEKVGGGYYSSHVGGTFKSGYWNEYVKMSKDLKKEGVSMSAGEISLIGRYTDGSGFINGYLSGKDAGLAWKGLLDDYRIAVNGALEKMPRYNGISYRGMKSYAADTIAEMQECLKSGSPYIEKCVMSTSTDIGNADGFDGYCMLKIYGRTGADCKRISSFSNEEEIIFRSGSKFKVLSVSRQQTSVGIGKHADIWVVELEDINL